MPGFQALGARRGCLALMLAVACGRTDVGRLATTAPVAPSQEQPNGDARGGSSGAGKSSSSNVAGESAGGGRGSADAGASAGGIALVGGAATAGTEAGGASDDEAGAAGDDAGGAAPVVEPPWVKVSLDLPPGFISRFAVDHAHPGTLYAGNFLGGGVYKTTTAGEHWQAVSQGLLDGNTRDLEVDPFNANVVYVATDRGLYRSRNGGAKWSNIDLGGGNKTLVWDITLDPNNEGRIYALVSDYWPQNALPTSELFRSNDSGTSWTSLGNPSDSFMDSVVVDSSDSNHLLLASYTRGIFSSTDGGESWQTLPQKPDITVQLLSYDPSEHILCAVAQGQMYASTDGGNSWKKSWGNVQSVLTLPGPTFYIASLAGTLTSSDCFSWVSIDNESSYAVAVEESGQTYLGAFDWAGGGVRRSADGRTDWVAKNEGLENGDVHALAIDPTAPETLFAAVTKQGVFRSKNGAQTWQSTHGAGPDGSVTYASVLAARAGVVLAGTSGVLFSSQDDGETWTQGGLPLLADDYTATLTSLAFDPFHPGRVHASAMTQYEPPPLQGIYTSDDDGLSFLGEPEAHFDGKLVVPDPATDGKLWALRSAPIKAPNALSVSNDGGKTWSPVALPVNGNASVLAVSSDGTVLYVGIDAAGIVKSTNSGASWSFCSKPEPAQYSALIVDPTDASTLYVATVDAAYDDLRAPPAAGKNNLVKSKDGGMTWSYAGAGMFGTAAIQTLNIDQRHPNILYAGTRYDGLYKTTTGGE